MVRGKARYRKNRPIPAPAGLKALLNVQLEVEEISAEEEKAIKQADIVLYEETLKEHVPSKLLKKAIEDELGELLSTKTETVIPTDTELTTSIVTPTGDEQAIDGFGKPINNKRKKKQP